MMESNEVSTADIKPKATESSTYRLVIRAEIIPEQTSPPIVPPHSDRRSLAAIVAIVAALGLGWIAFSVFGVDPNAEPAASVASRAKATSAVAQAPVESQAIESAAQQPSSQAADTTQPKSPAEPDASSAQLRQVTPDVPRSALQTIQGTVRVAIRVTVNEQGSVVAIASEVPGPSRYFERLATDAAKQWTFAPTAAQELRKILVRFNFTRAGVTASAEPAQ